MADFDYVSGEIFSPSPDVNSPTPDPTATPVSIFQPSLVGADTPTTFGNVLYGPGLPYTKEGIDYTPSWLASNSAYAPAFDPKDFLSKLVGSLKKGGSGLLEKGATPSGLLTGLAALYMLRGGSTPNQNPRGYTGPGINMDLKATRELLPQAPPQPYGSGRMGRQYFAPIKYAAEGGIMGMASGGASEPRYLRGGTDGMADKLDTTIDDHQPAKLSHGEFVIPADVVSHLGNGNSDAGADVLYKMMEKVRKARTGNPEQGKRINPEKFTPGGKAGYAGGGVVAFNSGGPSSLTTGQGSSTALPVSNESNLSSWAGPYITNMLSQGQALANTPYQAYTGALTAGASPLQQQAFTNASNLTTPAAIGQAAQMAGTAGNALGNLSYNPYTATNQYTSTSPYTSSNIGIDQFNTANMQQYMNPYLQMSLDPQIAEARRQQAITNQASQAKLAQAGAFGGSRDAIMRAEADRNLGSNLANITGQGYNNAFNTALGAFNTQQQMGLQAQQANEASRQFAANQALANAQNTAQYGNVAQQLNAQQQQFGANYGLQGLMGQLQAAQTQGNLGGLQSQTGLANLNALMGAGATQRGIESEGINADLAQFNKEQQYPYQQLQFQQGLMSGLPIGTNTVSTGTSGWGNFSGNVKDLKGLYETLQQLFPG